MRPFRLALFLAFVSVTAPIAAQSEFSSLEERMTQGDFTAAGLEKLSPEELKFLNEWLRRQGASVPSTVVGKPSASRYFYPEGGQREPVTSRIAGEFTGWRGNTVFKLENGQEWQQVQTGLNEISLSSPAVKIQPMMFGSWLMEVEGCDCRLRVRRIR